MKHLALLFGFVSLPFCTLSAQKLDNQLRLQYHEDAIQLAARIVSASNTSAEIPEHLVYTIEDMLLSVAEFESPKSTNVTSKYKIHTFPHVNTNEVQIYVESHVKWAKDLAEGKTKINNLPLQRIIDTYNLQTTVVSNEGGLTLFSLKSPKAVNMRYLANEISLTNNVILAEIPAAIGDGNDIRIKQIQGGWMISYYFKFGTCSTGCKNEYYWQFGIKDTGEVSFLGEYGVSLPTIDDGDHRSIVIGNE